MQVTPLPHSFHSPQSPPAVDLSLLDGSYACPCAQTAPIAHTPSSTCTPVHPRFLPLAPAQSSLSGVATPARHATGSTPSTAACFRSRPPFPLPSVQLRRDSQIRPSLSTWHTTHTLPSPPCAPPLRPMLPAFSTA